MVGEENLHRLIERPRGISGYRPAYWCAVCGLRVEKGKALTCTGDQCPNLCHEKCLDGTQEYSCGNTADLRKRLNISTLVTFAKPANHSPSPSFALPLPDPEEDSVCELSREELIGEVLSLRKELDLAKTRLREYTELTNELPEKRKVLLHALSIVDSLIAIKDNPAAVTENEITVGLDNISSADSEERATVLSTSSPANTQYQHTPKTPLIETRQPNNFPTISTNSALPQHPPPPPTPHPFNSLAPPTSLSATNPSPTPLSDSSTPTLTVTPPTPSKKSPTPESPFHQPPNTNSSTHPPRGHRPPPDNGLLPTPTHPLPVPCSPVPLAPQTAHLHTPSLTPYLTPFPTSPPVINPSPTPPTSTGLPTTISLAPPLTNSPLPPTNATPTPANYPPTHIKTPNTNPPTYQPPSSLLPTPTYPLSAPCPPAPLAPPSAHLHRLPNPGLIPPTTRQPSSQKQSFTPRPSPQPPHYLPFTAYPFPPAYHTSAPTRSNAQSRPPQWPSNLPHSTNTLTVTPSLTHTPPYPTPQTTSDQASSPPQQPRSEAGGDQHHHIPPVPQPHLPPLAISQPVTQHDGETHPPRKKKNKGRKNLPKRLRQIGSESAGGDRRQGDSETQKCSKCLAPGHANNQCPRPATCGYCQGRFHTTENCRERLADKRQQDLIEAVKTSGQETLAALRSTTWHLPLPTHSAQWGALPCPPPGPLGPPPRPFPHLLGSVFSPLPPPATYRDGFLRQQGAPHLY